MLFAPSPQAADQKVAVGEEKGVRIELDLT
jgi:hypothetical protein